jgi:hypothetical protein
MKKIPVVVAFILCLILALSTLASAEVGTWSIPTFVNDCPQGVVLSWSEQVNGIAHDDNNWFFTTTAPCRIIKVPLGRDLGNIDFLPPLPDPTGTYEANGMLINWGMPDELSDYCDGYYHYGDLDQVGGFLFVPIEAGPPSAPNAIAIFRASDLAYIGFCPTVNDTNSGLVQGWAGWVAYNPIDGCLYSSNAAIESNENNWLFRYTVDFDLLNSGDVMSAIQYLDRVELKNSVDSPLNPPLGMDGGNFAYMQGGCFSPWGDLYLINGSAGTEPNGQYGGIHLFRPDPNGSGKYFRVTDSVNGAAGFNFMWNPKGEGEEPEGIDWCNWSNGNLPLATQLHAILLNTEGGPDWLYIKHYIVNTPPTAHAGNDQTRNEGDTVTLNGTFEDPDPGDSWTYVWHMENGTNGQIIPDSTGSAVPSTPVTLIFVPCDNGVYTFSFTVTDSGVASGSDTVVVTVENVAPVVSAPYISNQENAEFILPMVHNTSFQGTFTDAGTCDTHTAVWAWGDGTTSNGNVTETNGSGSVANSHTYSQPDDYTVTLTVTDDELGHDTNTIVQPVHVADVDEALDIFNQYIQGLNKTKFKDINKADQRKKAYNNMFSALQDMWDDQEYQGMISSMNSNIRTTFDGMVGGRTKDDWIKQDPVTQTELCQKVDDITAYLHYLLSLMT